MCEQMLCLPVANALVSLAVMFVCVCMCVQESVAELYRVRAAHIAYNPVHVC